MIVSCIRANLRPVMFLKAISFLMVFIMLFTSLNKLVYYAGYALNKNYIAKVLCENKAKPKLHCNGKCFLAKQLKQAEKNEQKQNSPLKNQVEAFIVKHFEFRCFTFQIDEFGTPPALSYFHTTHFKIFQPPQA